MRQASRGRPVLKAQATAAVLGAAYEVDRDRHALEAEAPAQLVLDPVAVVAGDEPGIVDEEAEPRQPDADLSAVEEVEPAATRPARRLPRLAQLREGAVQLGRGDTRRVAGEGCGDPVEQLPETAARVRGDGHVGRTLSLAPTQLAADVLDTDRRGVPLREDDERGAVGVAGDVGYREVLLDDSL